MSSLPRVPPKLGAFVADEWAAHVADDFAALAATPSGGIVACCHAFRDDRALFTQEVLVAMAHGTLPEDRRARVTAAWGAAQQAHSVPPPASLHKLMLKEALRTSQDPVLRAQIEDALQRLVGIDSPKAAEIRAAMKPALVRLFGKGLASSGGGDWRVPLEVRGEPWALHVDTGGMGGGFSYYLRPRVAGGTAHHPGLSYEQALGLPAFKFDLLRTDRLETQLALWAARLEKLVRALEADTPFVG